MKKLILSLVLVLFISTSFMKVYSYYEEINTPDITESNTHILISQNMNTEDGKYLVPKGAVLGVDDTEKIVFTYEVFVQKGIKINYEIENIMINNEVVSSEITDLFEFEFEEKIYQNDILDIDIFNEDQVGYYEEITLTLSMNSPTEEQYFQIAQQQLSFEIMLKSIQ